MSGCACDHEYHEHAGHVRGRDHAHVRVHDHAHVRDRDHAHARAHENDHDARDHPLPACQRD